MNRRLIQFRGTPLPWDSMGLPYIFVRWNRGNGTCSVVIGRIKLSLVPVCRYGRRVYVMGNRLMDITLRLGPFRLSKFYFTKVRGGVAAA